MVQGTSERDGFARKVPRGLPNKALQRTALRAAAERQDVGRTTNFEAAAQSRFVTVNESKSA